MIKPRVKFANNREIIVDDVMPYDLLGILKPLNTTSEWLCIALIVVCKHLIGLCIIDTQTVDAGNIIVKSVGF